MEKKKMSGEEIVKAVLTIIGASLVIYFVAQAMI